MSKAGSEACTRAQRHATVSEPSKAFHNKRRLLGPIHRKIKFVCLAA